LYDTVQKNFAEKHKIFKSNGKRQTDEINNQKQEETGFPNELPTSRNTRKDKQR